MKIVKMVQAEIEGYFYLSLDYSTNTENSSANECNEVKPIDKADEIVEGFLLPTIGLVGIVNNFLGIYHFWKKRQRTYYALMFILATSDLALILSFTLYYSLPYLYHSDCESYYIACAKLVSYPVLYFSQTFGIYLTISLCFDRYNAICRPLSYQIRKWSIKTYIIPVFSFAFIYNLPLAFEFSGIETENVKKFKIGNDTNTFIGNVSLYHVKEEKFRYRPIYQQFYHTGLKLIFKCIFPYISLLFLNVSIIKTLYDANYTRQDNGNANKEKRTRKSSKQHRKITISSQQSVTISSQQSESDPLQIHLSDRQEQLRKNQIQLAIVNMVIAIVFLVSYSLIWAWAVHDFIHYMSSEGLFVSYAKH